MSFDTYEISDDAGQDVFFYEFHWGNTSWFYTSASRDLDLTLNGETATYEAVPIEDGGTTVGGDNPGDLKITVADNLPLVGLFRGTPPSENVRVVVIRQHVGDPEATIYFAGKINTVKRDAKKGTATLLCGIGKKKRGGLRLTWSRGCPHVLYDGQCRLARENFAYTAVVSAVTGTGFTVAAPPEKDATPESTLGFFDGGIVAWDADGLGTLEQRAIERGISDVEFHLFGRADGIEVGQAITMYPGCDRSTSTCNAKFNNLVNFGGVPLRGESPFGINLF